MSVARELLAAVVAELRDNPTLARDLREVLAIGAPPARAPEPLYMRVAVYAERVSMAERTVWSLVARGLPTAGQGRWRRIDVLRADEWLRTECERVDDAVERQARASAARAARKAAGS